MCKSSLSAACMLGKVVESLGGGGSQQEIAQWGWPLSLQGHTPLTACSLLPEFPCSPACLHVFPAVLNRFPLEL